MGSFLSLPILLIAAALQATFVPQIRLLGGGPELVFLLVLAWSINADLEEGVVWAFAGGIMQDLLSATPTGTSTLSMLLIVFAISGLGQQVYRIGIMVLIGLVLFGSLMQQIITMLILALNGFPIDWLTNLTYVSAPTIFYNLVFIWPVYWFVRRLQRRLTRDSRFYVD
ncbi:MAG: hypothetical protein OHK0046_05740 [Anaerolineae bacterium]